MVGVEERGERESEWRGLLRTMAHLSKAIWGLFMLSLPHALTTHSLFEDVFSTWAIQGEVQTSQILTTCLLVKNVKKYVDFLNVFSMFMRLAVSFFHTDYYSQINYPFTFHTIIVWLTSVSICVSV